MATLKAFHYTSKQFSEIDLSKCENGFWFTTISPNNFEDSEVGCCECNFVMTIEFDDNDVDYCHRESQSGICEYLANNEEKIARFGYETENYEYEDFVTFSPEKLKIVSVSKMDH